MKLKQIEQTMTKWEERQKAAQDEMNWLEENRKENNILMFGPEERVHNSCRDTVTGKVRYYSKNSKILSSFQTDW